MSFRSLMTILASVFLGVAGVYCFLHPQDSLVTLGWYLGFLMLFSGVSQLVRYASGKAARSVWQLLIALVDVLFGLWLLGSGNFLYVAAFLPLFFAGYMAARGVLMGVFYVKHKDILPARHMYLLCAAGQVLLGLFLLARPLIAAYTLIYAVGIGLLWCGFSTFYAWRLMEEKK